jgi:hypothetical protein
MFVLVFLAIAALPGSWSIQNPGSVTGPAIAWAGGTPDETLNPPPTPPSGSHVKSPKSGSYTTVPQGSPTLDTTGSAPSVRGTTWDAIWRMIHATMLRI